MLPLLLLRVHVKLEGVHELGAGEAPVGAQGVGPNQDPQLPEKRIVDKKKNIFSNIWYFPGHILYCLQLPLSSQGLQTPADVRSVPE